MNKSKDFDAKKVIKCESAILHALSIKNVLMFQRVWRTLRGYVLTCLACLDAHMARYLACLNAHVATCLTCLTCQHTLRAYVLTFQRCMQAKGLTCQHDWVPCLKRLARPRDHLQTWLASSVSSFDAIFFGFTAIVVEIVHIVGKI